MRLEVEVTRDDILFGKPCQASNCPVARALNRVECVERSVTWPHRIGVQVSGRWRWAEEVPGVVSQFMHDFDLAGGEPVEPFSFQLEVA